jgi:lipoprotein-releasing system permease protein
MPRSSTGAKGIVLALLSAAILAFGILAWDKASGLSAEEKARDRHPQGDRLGNRRRDQDEVLGRLLVSLTAFLLGFVAAYVHVFHFAASLFEPVLKGWAVLYPRFQLTPQIDGLQVATLFFFTVCPTPRRCWCRSGKRRSPTRIR